MPPKSLVERNYYERLELTEEADAEAVKKVRWRWRPPPSRSRVWEGV